MKISAGITGDGISLELRSEPSERLEPSKTASQTSPRHCYVYGHYDGRGVPFYIGKGTGRRAWNDDRHPLWHRFVKHRLNGVYTTVILADGLDTDDAEDLENQWIFQESETLINWINFGRKTDFSALDTFHKERDANRELMAYARNLELLDLEQAIAAYYRALHNVASYAAIEYEQGLIGQLLAEEKEELGASGSLRFLTALPFA